MKNTIMILGLSFFLSWNAIDAIESIVTPQLTVRGEAFVVKPTNQAQITFEVYTQGQDSTVALNENNRMMHQVVENLKNVGLDESDYKTGRFSIKPIYQTDKKDSSKEDRSKLLHYEVVNSIAIDTSKISLMQAIIDAAVKGGANQVRGINFNLNNPQAYQQEVIALATQNAMQDAKALAEAAGVNLVRVISLSLDRWNSHPQPLALYSKRSDAAESTVPLEAGNAEIHAAVNIIYEIGS